VVFSRLLANEGIVGVDIGTSSIKIAHAEASRQGFVVPHVTICPTPPDSVREGTVTDIPGVAGAVQFAMRSAGIKASSGIVAIAGPGVLVRHVQLPRMAEQVLRKSIHFEAGKFISTSMEDSVVEFEILGDGEEAGQMKVMLVAAPKAMVESRVGVLEQAGLEPLAVDVEAFATFRALLEYNPDRSFLDSTVALLDMGASHTEINLVCKGNLALTRTVPIAGASLTNAIKSAENCTEDEAEQRKHGFDLSELVDVPAGSTGDPGLKTVQSLVDEMLREVRRSVNYLQSQLPDGAADATVDRIILTGGAARLGGVAAYTSNRLNIGVSVGNPALGDLIQLSPEAGLNEEDIPLLAVAFGLAVKEMRAQAQMLAAA